MCENYVLRSPDSGKCTSGGGEGGILGTGQQIPPLLFP